MARVHEIAVASETGAFEKGIKSGVIKPLEDAEKALKELGDTNVGKDIDRDLDAAQRATKNLKDETKDAADAIERDFRESYARTKAAAKDASDSAGQSFDTTAEASAELKQNLGETFSSFRGDLEDLPQIAQDVFGGLAGSVGGILPAIGLAAGAAGIGLLINAFNTAGEESDEFKAKAAELAQAYIDATGEAGPAIEDIADAIRELATTTEDGATTLADLKKVAGDSKNDFEDLARAYAGNADGLDELIQKGKEKQKQLEDEAQAYDETNRQGERHYGIIQGEAEAQARYNDYLREAKGAADLAAEAEKNWREAGGEELAIKAQLVDTISDAYDGVRDSAVGAATSEEGVFDVGKWAEYVASTKVQVEQYQANLQGLKLSPGQWANLMEMPESARMAVVASLASGPEEAKGKIIAALTDAGASAADGAQVSFDEGFNPKADVDVKVDTSDGESKVRELTKDREMKIRVRMDTSEVDGWNPPRKSATVTAVVDKSAWNNWTPVSKTGRVNIGGMG